MQSVVRSELYLRLMKVALVLSVTAWGVIGAMGNLMDWTGTSGSVAAVAGMDFFEGGAADWRATSNPIVVYAGATFIVAFKSLCALFCLFGAAHMWRERAGEPKAFARSKSLAIIGCMIGVFGLFSGWIVIGEGWFEFWRDPGLGVAGGAAFRYGGFIGVIALLVAQPE